MPRMSLGTRYKAGGAEPQRKRRFFSSTHLPPLPTIIATPAAPRSVASDRVLAALQTDEKAVVAAKNFVKEKMGDDKWDTVDMTRVTRNATTAAAIAKGTPPTKRHAATATATASATPPVALSTTTSAAPSSSTPSAAPTPPPAAPPSPRQVPSAKILPKRLALGSATQAIAQRIKAKGVQVGGQVARKVALRSKAPKQPVPVASTSAPPPKRVGRPPNHARVAQLIAAETRSTPNASSDEAEMDEDDEEEESEDESEDDAYEPNPGKRKEFLVSGLYCQEEDPTEQEMLINRVLNYRISHPIKRGPGRPRKSLPDRPIPTPKGQPVCFPPLPLEYHYDVFFPDDDGAFREFTLPYDIMWESETGALDGKKRPPFYQKIRTNHFVERSKIPAYNERAVCNCDPDYGCGDNCINFIMSYLCGTGCPCGDQCGNRSLARRKGKGTKVVWTGSRGFGLFATEDIKEGDFVADYRGEIIHINTFIERIGSTYKGKKNFYALAYERDEVIDAGIRGNDTRFINHGCNPNLEVRKYGTLGDGFDEYEVGMWAKRDIRAGEELFYNYNFDSFAVMVNKDDERQRCMCGAPNCVGFLGRKQGEKSAKELAAEMALNAAAKAAKDKRSASVALKRGSTSTPGRNTPSPASAPPELPSVSEPPKKNKGGRPRKHPLIEPFAGPSTSTPKGKAARVTGTPATDVTMTPGDSDSSPVRRKRGRPPKVPDVGKRPRGRPRVHPLPDPAAPVIKRPRGRPRKSNAEDTESVFPTSPPPFKIEVSPTISTAALPGPSPLPKRRPGRPPKVRPAPYTIPERNVSGASAASASSTRNRIGAVLGAAAKTIDSSLGSLKLKFTIPGRSAETAAAADAAESNAEASGSGTAADEPPAPKAPSMTPKQVEKRKRNGAPAGWVYVPVGAPAPEPEPAAEVAPGSRAARLAARKGN